MNISIMLFRKHIKYYITSIATKSHFTNIKELQKTSYLSMQNIIFFIYTVKY